MAGFQTTLEDMLASRWIGDRNKGIWARGQYKEPLRDRKEPSVGRKEAGS